MDVPKYRLFLPTEDELLHKLKKEYDALESAKPDDNKSEEQY